MIVVLDSPPELINELGEDDRENIDHERVVHLKYEPLLEYAILSCWTDDLKVRAQAVWYHLHPHVVA